MSEQALPRVVFVSGYVSQDPEPRPSALIVAQQESLRKIGVSVEPFYIGGVRYVKYPQSMRRFRRFIENTDADVIHAHWVYSGLLAECQRRLPTVVSFMGGDILIESIVATGERVRAGLTFLLSQLSASIADQVIVKSEEMRQHLWRHKDVHVVPNGVDLEVFRPVPMQEAREALGLHPHRRYVLFPSLPERPEKDFPLAEAAFAMVRQSHDDVELLTLGAARHDEVPLYMNAVDVLLLTSISEGSPNAIKEAMACNLPVVSTDVGDVRATVDGAPHCHVVTSRAPEAIAAALNEVLCARERTDGRCRIGHLDSGVVARRLVDIYRAACASRS